MPVGFRLFIFILTVTGMGAAAAPLKVGLVLDKGGRDDKSFNASAFQGVTDAQKKLGVEIKVVDSSDDSAIEPSLRNFAQRNYDLVIGVGFAMTDPVTKVAQAFPKTKFLQIDSVAKGSNVRSVTFKEHEGSFLVGYLAALSSKTKTIGFIGGMDVPLIRRFETGFRAGIEKADPKARLLTNYVGSTSDAWKNPTRAKELATTQFQKGADVIFAAAGTSGLGAFDAAEEKKKLVIGVDSNQNWIKPGLVLTSMLKRIDLTVYDTIEKLQKGVFQTGHVEVGFAEGMIDYALDEHNRKLVTPEMQKQADLLKKDIQSGKTVVPDYYLQKKSKSAAD